MITHARWGCWETNSSSVHQIIIRTDEPQLIDKPKDGLIVRAAEFNLGDKDMTTAQEKLDVIVQCIIQHETYDNTEILRSMFHLINVLQENDIEVTIDDETFVEHYYPALSDDVIEKIITMLLTKPDKIATLIFDPSSKFTGDHNSYKYDGSKRLLYEDNPEYEKFEVFTGDY